MKGAEVVMLSLGGQSDHEGVCAIDTTPENTNEQTISFLSGYSLCGWLNYAQSYTIMALAAISNC